jgi:predicted O-linked N-acetylglucosamine transferase (SPINDLY family)
VLRELLRRLRPAAGKHAELARALIARQEYAAAAEELGLAARLEPDNASWPAAQADCHARAGDLQSAARCLETALGLAPREPMLWTKLGYARWELALVDEAIAAYRHAVACDPRAEPAGGNLLFALLHRSESPAEGLAEAKRWAQCAAPAPAAAAFANSPDPDRRLRIGYVSADLRNHAMAPFIEAILAWRDAERFDVACYDGTAHPDEVSTRLQGYGALWRPIGKLDDAAFEAQVRSDAIDILVDLSGHTGGNRLRAFARRLAPVQVCNHGYPATTGLACFDWRLTDARNDPPGAEAFYTEPLYRLPEFSFCYQPAAAAPVPRAGGGPLTFASLNNVRKITPRMVDLWARILLKTPGARLLIAGTPPGPARERIVAQLARAGVGPQRLELHGWLPQAAYAALHGRIDIALDTYPYNGSTTSFEALFHGVPVVTLSGPVFVSRHGRATLEVLGESRLAAESDEGYVAAALQLAREDLGALRGSLHERMKRSPMLDGRGYASRVETAYRDMWRRWSRARS